MARSLIKDGVTGYTEAELAEDLMNDPDNPFRPRSREEILRDVKMSMRQVQEGEYYTADEVSTELEKILRRKGAK